MLKYKYIFQIQYTEAILSNIARKLLWFEITRMLIAVLKSNLLCHLAYQFFLLFTFFVFHFLVVDFPAVD